MKKMIKAFFNGADTKLQIATRVYILLVLLTVLFLIFETNFHTYQSSKLEIGIYTVVFFIYPFGLLVAYFIKGGEVIKKIITKNKEEQDKTEE